MSANPGDIITMANFQQNGTGFLAAPKHVFVLMVLGQAVRGSQGQFDPGAALRRIGWYPESDFGPAEPGTGALEDRAAELAASMKVMAALHRANEDVAAADEFAKGAGLVLELDSERQRLLRLLEVDVVDLLQKVSYLRGTLEQHDLLKPVLRMIEGLKPEPELTEEALTDRLAFYAEFGSCSCHQNPPCGYCTHPGNPANQDDPSCWKPMPKVETTAELKARAEAAEAGAERWRFGVAVNHDVEFAAAMDPLMDWTDTEKVPETEEEANAWADRCIQTARDAGLWPRPVKEGDQ